MTHDHRAGVERAMQGWVDRQRELAQPKPKRERAPPRFPLEAEEQKAIVEHMHRVGILCAASLNGAHLAGTSPVERARKWAHLRRLGASPGFPDIEVFGPPHVYLEVKRVREAYGGPKAQASAVSPEQAQWHETLRRLGHMVTVGWGCDDALVQLRALGVRC